MAIFAPLEDFDPREIDARWQGVWERDRSWEVSNDQTGSQKSAYVLEMLPYTSGEPHIGHLKNYAVGDAVAHFMRRNGWYVLHPMGYDAFGLPAENHAIRTGMHPRTSTDESIVQFREQFKQWGISIDWTREISTHQPTYYRWTQWIFVQLFKSGLAYRKDAAVNWCPKDATVLANEQVINGRCERCGTPVELRQLEQWFFRITDYAERLLRDLDGLEWPPHVKTMQRNWIGRSDGAEITFRCADVDLTIDVFTTRPDTLPGATFLVLAPEHPDLNVLVAGTPEEAAVHEYINEVRRAGNAERGVADRPKTGVFTGRHAIHPLSGEQIPIYVADYVFMEYGTGSIMAVPAHDERDFEFAQVKLLPIRRVVADPTGAETDLPYIERGVATNSGPEFDGHTSSEAIGLVTARLERDGAGRAATGYKLRDWLLSRQRYWGCPIPIVYCDSCGLVPVPEEHLPVLLPDVEDYAPKGRSPLATAEDWVVTTCPKCGGPGRRETDTMDTFVDSSWYYLRYCDPANTQAPWGEQAISKWMPVFQYIGGIEHAILHLLYSRFLCKALADLGLLTVQEPFHKLFTQGMITKDGAKMSKSKGNVVSPRTLIEKYGADTARAYVLFMGPPDVGAEWSDEGVEGVYRFLKRLWTLTTSVVASKEETIGGKPDPDRDHELTRDTHIAIKKVTDDMSGKFAFNTAIAALMKLYNSCSRLSQEGIDKQRLTTALSTLASLLFPFAPHVASEVYFHLTGEYVWLQPWPVADDAILRTAFTELALQVNSKNLGTLRVASASTDDAIRELALEHSVVRKATGDDESRIKRVIVVPERLVNVVVAK